MSKGGNEFDVVVDHLKGEISRKQKRTVGRAARLNTGEKL